MKRLLLLVVCVSMLSSISLRARGPNIVMILADDLGWADLHHDGSKIDTPNLDRLAQQGVKLTRFHSSAPMCSPTRSALLTGRYPHSVGVPELASPTTRGKVPVLELSHDAITIPEALGPAGYRNIMVGKWHLGFAPRAWPRTHGFDEFWGSLIGTPTYWQPKETYHNETRIEVPGYYTDRLTDKAIEYLQKTKAEGKPIFLYLAYNAPHYPLEAPSELVGKYRRRLPKEGLFAIYAAMVEQLDTGIGRVLATLDELGMTQDTLVVFTSDNGPTAELTGYGPEGADISNGPLREHKFSTHEGGIRVPFLARWPGRIPAGTVRDDLAVTMDLMPTFLDAAGVTANHEMNGRSILPLLTGGTFKRTEAVHWENQHNAAVIRGEWKLVHQFWRPQPFLYRWLEDTSENNDLAAKNPEIVKELMRLHEQWKARYYPNPVPRVTTWSSYLFPMAERTPGR